MTRGFIGLMLTLMLAAFPVEAADKASETPETVDLKYCLGIALVGNPEIQKASTGHLTAEGRAIALRAILYPKAGVQVLSMPMVAYVKIEQVLYERGRAPQLELARLAPEQAEANFRVAVVEALYQTRVAYLAALGRARALRLLENHAAHSRESFLKARELFDAGRIQKSDMARLEVRKNRAYDKWRLAGAQYRESIASLSRVMGRELSPGVQLAGELGTEPVPGLDIAALTQEALQRRPDYRLLKTTKAIDEEMLKLSTRRLFPELAASSESTLQAFPLSLSDFDANRNDDEPNLQREDGDSQTAVGIRLSWVFFDGGYSKGQKAVAGTQLSGRKETMELLEKSISGEVAQCVGGVKLALSTLEILGQHPKADDLRSLADIDLVRGAMRYVDRCAVDDGILEQELKALETRLNFSLYCAALDHSVGRVAEFVSP